MRSRFMNYSEISMKGIDIINPEYIRNRYHSMQGGTYPLESSAVRRIVLEFGDLNPNSKSYITSDGVNIWINNNVQDNSSTGITVMKLTKTGDNITYICPSCYYDTQRTSPPEIMEFDIQSNEASIRYNDGTIVKADSVDLNTLSPILLRTTCFMWNVSVPYENTFFPNMHLYIPLDQNFIL